MDAVGFQPVFSVRTKVTPMLPLASALRYFHKRAALLLAVRKASVYSGFQTRAEIEAYQLERFNEVWADAITNVPYYARIRSEHHLPGRFGSLAELEAIPYLTREILQSQPEEFRRSHPPDSTSRTGGTTGVPLTFGTMRGESLQGAANVLVGRFRFGVDFGARTYLIWGHSHLFGEFPWRWIRMGKRMIGDAVMNYRRKSAYFLTPDKLHEVFNDMLRWKPSCVIGYSSALVAFASANWDRRAAMKGCPLRAVIYTAEFASPQARQMLAGFFQVPIVGEYGCLECGVMAYSTPAGGYRVFWDSVLLSLDAPEGNTGTAIVTSLTPKYTPMIRYNNDDLLIVPEEELHQSSLLALSDVIGRGHDVLKFEDGTCIHGQALDACFTLEIDWVMQAQVVQRGTRSLTIRIVASREIGQAEREMIRGKITRLHPEFGKAEIEQVQKIDSTVAGKRKWIIRLPEAP